MESPGKVRIVRKSSFDIKMRDLVVRIDDGESQNIKFGGELELDISPGAHTIYATNRVYNRKLEFEVGDQPVTFEVANTARGCAGALFTMGFGPYACELRQL